MKCLIRMYSQFLTKFQLHRSNTRTVSITLNANGAGYRSIFGMGDEDFQLNWFNSWGLFVKMGIQNAS